MWNARLTVACVVVHEGRFLMVKEWSEGSLVINQPAGHVEKGESLVEAAVRETLEETCWSIEITHGLGVSQYHAPNGNTYFRHSFIGRPLGFDDERERDSEIVDTLWMSAEELKACIAEHRSPMVLNDIQRYRNGIHIPIEGFYRDLF